MAAGSVITFVQRSFHMKFAIVAAVLALSSASALAEPGKDKDKGQGPSQGSFAAGSHANPMGIEHANSHSVLSTVPEADSMVMLLAGVAVVGALALRRRK